MKPGDQVSDFTLLDDDRNPRTLSDLLANGPVVLFFYPMASSGGCTQEACHFRDLASEFKAVNAQPVGISSDNVTKQSVFSNAHGFGYPLLSDEGHKVAKELGAYRSWLPGGLHTRRLTYVIDTDRTVIDVFGSESKFDEHADHALEVLKKRQTA